MIRLGLTGSIGMGKSTVAAMFEEAGVPVFDADAAVHALQGPGGALVAAIEAAFPGTTGPGGVDRTALARACWAIARRWRGWKRSSIRRWRRCGCAFSTTMHPRRSSCSTFPCCSKRAAAPARCGRGRVRPAAVQRARVLARPGMTPEKLERILTLQMPDAEKRRLADHVIDTGVPHQQTRARVHQLIACLTGAKGG